MERMVPLVTSSLAFLFCFLNPPSSLSETVDDVVVVVFPSRHPNDGKVLMTMITNPYQQLETGALRPPLHADR